jgi:hypothetical protein
VKIFLTLTIRFSNEGIMCEPVKVLQRNVPGLRVIQGF